MINITQYKSAKKYSDKLSVIKYNVEGNKVETLKIELLLQGVMIRALPTLVLYNNGKQIATHAGAITETDLDEWIQHHLSEMSANDIETTTSARRKAEEQPQEETNDVGAADGGKRGFVSFGFERDDYAL